jgi:hypothetical protein
VAEKLTSAAARALAAGIAPADLARLGAEYGLGEHEQTQFDREYPPYRAIGLLILPVSVVFVPVCVIAFVAQGSQSQLNFEFGLVFTTIIGCLVVAGALLIWCPRPLRLERTFWFSGGLIQFTLAEPEPRVVRWDDVVSLTVQIYRPDEGPPYIWSSVISDRDGTSVGMRGITRVSYLPRTGLATALAAKASGLLVPKVVPAFIREFEAGQRVTFGDVWIDRSGVCTAVTARKPEPEFVAWQDVRKIGINARTGISVGAVGRRRDLFIDLGNIPNGFFTHYLIDHAAAKAGLDASYAGEKRMPARVPTGGMAGV